MDNKNNSNEFDFPGRSASGQEGRLISREQLEQLKNLLDAFLGCTYFVLVIFLVIVMIGILNTYRVIVYERTREIGTMRAIGMQAGDVRRIFLYEAAALAVIASAVGFILGMFFLLIKFFIFLEH